MPRVVGGGGLHAALPDVSVDQHHVQLHAAAHLPAGGDPVDNNITDIGVDLIAAVLGNSVVTGSGTNNLGANGRGEQMTTGVTNPSSCSHRIVMSIGGAALLTMNRLRRFSYEGYIADVYANCNSFALMTDESVDTIPSLIARHIGFKQVVGVVSFTTADGAVEQATDISAFVAAGTHVLLVATFDGVTARCYVNGTLRATHAANVPVAGGGIPVFRLFINNNATANSRVMNPDGFRVRFAAS